MRTSNIEGLASARARSAGRDVLPVAGATDGLVCGRAGNPRAPTRALGTGARRSARDPASRGARNRRDGGRSTRHRSGAPVLVSRHPVPKRASRRRGPHAEGAAPPAPPPNM